MNNKLQPALVAGAVSAFFAIVLNIITTMMQTPGSEPSAGLGIGTGCLSCLITIGAGAFAVYLYVQKSSVPATTGDGAVLGLLTGLISAAISLVIGTPLSYFINREALETQMAPMREQFGFDGSTLMLLLLFGALGFIITPIITLIGGLIGVPIFEKRKGDAGMPPPPPSGGYGGGGGAPGGFSGTQPGAGGFNQPPPPMGGSNPGGGFDR